MPLLDVFWAMLWFFLWIAWIWLVVLVFFDIFRSHDLGGWSKAVWAIAVLLLPMLGVFVYLLARGDSLHERSRDVVRHREGHMDDYFRSTAGTSTGVAQEIETLDRLRQQGVLTDQEFQSQKARLLA
jgi:Short C-terminal domain/Phospholipase_D-nuclease N-terminal